MELLAEKLKLASTTKARNMVKEGSVQVNGETITRADRIVEIGDTVQVKKAERKPPKVPDAPFELLFQDDCVVVAVKPAGILSVNRDNENSKTFYKMVNEYIREISKKKERVFLVHRLDREVSGIMIFAKSLEIQQQLENRWRENEKRYYALVEGVPPQKEGKVESWLTENIALKVYSTLRTENAKHAITHYKVVEQSGNLTLVEVQLDTGRKHQIRVHLADMGCPIVGDKKYGAKSDPLGRIALHAFRFSFHHPITGEYLTFETPMPKEIAALNRS